MYVNIYLYTCIYTYIYIYKYICIYVYCIYPLRTYSLPHPQALCALREADTTDKNICTYTEYLTYNI